MTQKGKQRKSDEFACHCTHNPTDAWHGRLPFLNAWASFGALSTSGAANKRFATNAAGSISDDCDVNSRAYRRLFSNLSLASCGRAFEQ